MVLTCQQEIPDEIKQQQTSLELQGTFDKERSSTVGASFNQSLSQPTGNSAVIHKYNSSILDLMPQRDTDSEAERVSIPLHVSSRHMSFVKFLTL